MEKITDQEKAAIYYHIFANCQDRHILYRIAAGETKYNKLTDSSKKVTVNRWFNLPRIQEFIKLTIYEQQRQKEILTEKIKNSVDTEASQREPEKLDRDNVNFLDRDQFLEYLNKKANSQTDEKLQNETLKMLSDNLRYKEGDQENSEIQRFYVPILCENCKIYQKCSRCSLSGCPDSLK